MFFSYGEGQYIEGDKNILRQIILGEHKLYLKGPQGDLTQTYIPLEKIVKLKKIPKGLEIHVRPSITIKYIAFLYGDKSKISDLIKDLVSMRGFKKVFWRNEWIEPEY